MIVIPISTGVGFDSSSPLPPPLLPAPCPVRPRPASFCLRSPPVRTVHSTLTRTIVVHTVPLSFPFRSRSFNSSQTSKSSGSARTSGSHSHSIHPFVRSVQFGSRRTPSRTCRAVSRRGSHALYVCARRYNTCHR